MSKIINTADLLKVSIINYFTATLNNQKNKAETKSQSLESIASLITENTKMIVDQIEIENIFFGEVEKFLSHDVNFRLDSNVPWQDEHFYSTALVNDTLEAIMNLIY